MGNIISIIIGYALGSIPFGLILAQAAGLGDVRKIGSGSIGATNVLRTGNKTIAALTLLCDALKGLVPVLIANHFWGTTAGILAGFAALAGHIFPVWLGFKGGKGVATALGVLLGWSWLFALIAAAVWIVVFLVRRISSLAALSTAVLAVPVAYFVGGNALWPQVSIIALAVIITHRANIGRLLRGEEPRSTFSKKT